MEEYWARVHIMGNKGSPAIANLGLREAAKLFPVINPSEIMAKVGRAVEEQKPWEIPYHEGLVIRKDSAGSIDRVEEFLAQQMYVDDGLGSGESAEEVVKVLRGAVLRLGRVGLR